MLKNKNKITKNLSKHENKEISYKSNYYNYFTFNYTLLTYKEKEYFHNGFSKPKNKSQEIYLKNLNKIEIKIVIATGPAGTGKTLFATENALKNLLLHKCEKIVFTRPCISVDEEIGFLPGSLEDKMLPWMRPVYDILSNFICPTDIKELIDLKIIEISPLGYMRGRTFKNCWIIADEMQNSTVSQMKMLLTRIGENTKLIITGDLEQNDLYKRDSGLEHFLEKLKRKRSESISSIEFDKNDIEREPIVKEVLEIYYYENIPIIENDQNSIIEETVNEDLIPPFSDVTNLS